MTAQARYPGRHSSTGGRHASQSHLPRRCRHRHWLQSPGASAGGQALMVRLRVVPGLPQCQRNWRPLPAAPQEIDAIIPTHAHSPFWLPAAGWRGTVLAAGSVPAARVRCAPSQLPGTAATCRRKRPPPQPPPTEQARVRAAAALSRLDAAQPGKPCCRCKFVHQQFEPLPGWRATTRRPYPGAASAAGGGRAA